MKKKYFIVVILILLIFFFLVLSRVSYSLIEDDKIIKQLNVNTTVSQVLSGLEISFDSAVVYNSKNVIKSENEYIATGDILVVYSNNIEKNIYCLFLVMLMVMEM